jgi:hypothetical protein
MDTSRQTPGRAPRRGFGVMVLLAILFIAVASIFSPFKSSASDPSREPGATDGVFLGQAVTRDHQLLVHATADGPRYTVKDSRGRTLAADLAPEDVYRMFPDLAPEALHAGPDDAGPLMLVEPEH